MNIPNYWILKWLFHREKKVAKPAKSTCPFCGKGITYRTNGVIRKHNCTVPAFTINRKAKT